MGGWAIDALLKSRESISMDAPKVQFPFLDELLEKECFSKIDLFFARRALATCSSCDESLSALLCTLFYFSRQGHLCLPLEEKALSCLLDDLNLEKEQKLKLFDHLIKAILPDDLVEEMSLPSAHPTKLLCRYGDLLYLQRNYIFETKTLFHLDRLLQASPVIPVQSIKEQDCLNLEQQQALKKALENSLTLITGGPGTGKTFTAGRIVRAFLSGIEKKDARIVLTAPTGKAAAHLEMSLRGHIQHPVSCGTLHAQLGIRSSKDLSKEGSALFADLIIVDECSMIDARLFSYLLASVSKGTRLVLMGDRYQLPPVEQGSLFADFVEAAEKGHPIPCAHLKESLRSKEQSILKLAQAVNRGAVPEVLNALSFQGPVKRVDLGLMGNDSKAACILLEHIKEELPLSSSEALDPKALLQDMKRFRILSCMRKGPLGVDAINAMILQSIKESLPLGYSWAAPILITRSNAELGLYNGDMGMLIHSCREKDRAVFEEKDGSFRSISSALLPPFEYAYCLSVHKCQGSEYDKILLFVPKGSEVFGKEVLYTAITRAKNAIEIDVSDETLQKLLARDSRKFSGIHTRLLGNTYASLS